MENKITVIVDSTADLSKELVEKYKIKVVPLHIRVPGEDVDYLDGITMTTLDLYNKVDQYGKIPQTSARNVGEFINDFKEEIDKGNDVIYIGIGSNFSSTYQNANIAKEEFDPNHIKIIDSKSFSFGVGLLAIKIAKMRDEGLNIHEIAAKIEELKPLVVVQSCLKTFEYLHKSGRCKGFVRFIANALKLHPIVRIKNGELGVHKITRGKFQFGLDAQIKEFKEDLAKDNVDLDTVTVIDAYRTEGEENYLFDEIAKLIPQEKIYRMKAGCIISAHCGPGTTGLYYLKKR